MGKEKINNQVSDYMKDTLEYYDYLRQQLNEINRMELSMSLEEHVSKQKSKEMFNRIRGSIKKS